MTVSGVLTTYVGSGFAGSSGDGGPATSAMLQHPLGVAVDSLNNVYIADTNNNKIRLVSSVGIITTCAGTGSIGSSGNGGAATNALLYNPRAIAVDRAGENIYVAEPNTYRIRLIVRSTGIITMFAGSIYGYYGDGGMATNARLSYPNGVAVDVSNNV